MNEYRSEYEKQEMINDLRRKANRLKLFIYAIAAAALVLYFDMKRYRNIPSDMALAALIGLAVAALIVRIVRVNTVRCPFCGVSFAKSSNNLAVVPKHCPECGEKLKY